MVCVNNSEYPASLELGKVYRVLPDESAEPYEIRIVDESGEDYLYPAEYFSPMGQSQVAISPSVHTASAPPRDTGADSLEESMTEPLTASTTASSIKSCFVIGPIGDRQAAFGSEERLRYEQAIEIWDYVIQPACEALGIDPLRADKIDEPGEITEQTFEHLRDADLVIADLTGGNANVMYELGLRHTTGKLTVQIGEKERLPFDVTVIRTIQFLRSETGLIEAREGLKRAISTGVERGPRSVTATRVWLSIEHDTSETYEPETLEEQDEEGPGFLDLMVETEEALPLLNDVSEGLAAVMGELPPLTQSAVEEMAFSDARGKGAAGRLVAATKLATELEGPASLIEQLAADFVSQLERMDPGISYLLSRLREEPETRNEEGAAQFIESMEGLVAAAEESLGQVRMLADSVQDLGKISNRLRPVSRRMSTALRKISECWSTIQEWGRRLSELE